MKLYRREALIRSRETLAIVLKEQLFDLANQKFILNLSLRGFAFQMRLKAVVRP